MPTSNFGERLKQLRREKNLTQEQLAEVFGVARNSIFSYETGRRIPDIEVLKSYAEYFGVTSDYLLGLSDNRTPETTAIGDKLGLSDEAIECLELYARCNEILEELPENDVEKVLRRFLRKISGHLTDETEKEFIDRFGELHSCLNILSEKTHGDNWGNIGLTVYTSMPEIQRVINSVLCNIDFLNRLSVYLFAEYGNAVKDIDTEHLDDEIFEMLTTSHGGIDNLYDPEYMERSRLLDLEDVLKSIRQEIIKQQEETNAKENKRQE